MIYYLHGLNLHGSNQFEFEMIFFFLVNILVVFFLTERFFYTYPETDKTRH